MTTSKLLQIIDSAFFLMFGLLVGLAIAALVSVWV